MALHSEDSGGKEFSIETQRNSASLAGREMENWVSSEILSPLCFIDVRKANPSQN